VPDLERAAKKDYMMKQWIVSSTLLISIFIMGCKGSTHSRSDAEDLLRLLSSGDSPAQYAGIYGDAVDKLRSAQAAQDTPITFAVNGGDADAPIGDGSCDYHAFAYAEGADAPFLGIRLAHEGDGWHIAGYWTPNQADVALNR
jgi:hypothetical protein